MNANKRLIIDLRPEEHAEIKARASLQGKTIKTYVLERVLQQESCVTTQNPWAELATWAHAESPLHGQSQRVADASRAFRAGFGFK